MIKPVHAEQAVGEGGYEEPDLMLVESNHRIANSLSLAAAMLRMQREKFDEPEVRQAILDAEMRIESIARLHAYLHRHRSSDRINLADFLGEVLPQIGAVIGTPCMLSIDLSGDLIVSARLAMQITIIVNELALNALKHGYGGVEGGTVRVGLGKDDNGQLKLAFSDHGAGLPDDFDPEQGEGLGLRIVTSLIHELGGALFCQSDGGARFTILIPSV